MPGTHLVLDADIGAVFNQQPRRPKVPPAGGHVEGGVPVLPAAHRPSAVRGVRRARGGGAWVWVWVCVLVMVHSL